MRDLSQVYESARLSAPLPEFPERRHLPAWSQLDPKVRTELIWINENLLSVVRGREQILRNFQRVITDYNHGLRTRFQGNRNGAPEDYSTDPVRQWPFRAAQDMDQRTEGVLRADPRLERQFITATRLLGHEFGQLDESLRAPFEFLMRHVSPEHVGELGELASALPALFTHEQQVLQRLLAETDFSYAQFYEAMEPAPSHLGYVTLGTVALFDPDPTSWRRAGASMGLALTPFTDSTTLGSTSTDVPQGAVRTVFKRPIAAYQAVRRQMERIELAREWTGLRGPSIDFESVEERQATLYDVWQMTTASRIRSQDNYLVDLVADIVSRAAAAYLETTTPGGMSRLGHLRRQLPAFLRGFDARYEGVVDPKALESAAFGRSHSDGLRRFEGGGLLIGAISNDLGELCVTLNDVHHASQRPGDHVMTHLNRIQETSATAEYLLELFELRPSLLRDLFEGQEEVAFHAMTETIVGSPYDLLRAAFFSVLRGVGRGVLTQDKRELQIESARTLITRIVHEPPSPQPRSRTGGALVPARAGDPLEGRVREAAKQFVGDFDALVRLMRHLWLPLHVAQLLSAPRSEHA